MILSETGQSRVNGYLFVLRRALDTFLPRDVVRDAIREIESHLRDRIAAAIATPDERTSLERILNELGPPLRVAQAYSAERIIDEAVTTGRVVPMLRAAWHLGVTTIGGFFVVLGVTAAYAVGLGFLGIALMKPVFPNNVGLWADEAGVPHSLAAQFPAPAGQHVVGGYWIVPLCLAIGVGVLVLSHRALRKFLAWCRARRSGANPPFVG